MIGHGREAYEHACGSGGEGIVSKRIDGPYEGRRSRSWIKVKCTRRQEFVIGGYTEPAGARQYFGALLLGAGADVWTRKDADANRHVLGAFTGVAYLYPNPAGRLYLKGGGGYLAYRRRLAPSLPLVFPWLLYPVISQGDQIIDNLSINAMRAISRWARGC